MIQFTPTVRALIVLVILHIITFLIERYRYNKFLEKQKANNVTNLPSIWERLIDMNVSEFTIFVFAIDIVIILSAIAFWIIYPAINIE